MYQGDSAGLSGYLNILKPPGMTSADVVAYVRKIAKVKRVGHGGTLDPGAAGVLPIAIGPATRLVEYLHQCYKAYRAEVTFGVVTDTYDAQGKIVAAQPGCKVAVAHLERALDQFRGEIEQRPPAHSALKVQGRRLYDPLSLEGGDVDLRRRHAVQGRGRSAGRVRRCRVRQRLVA